MSAGCEPEFFLGDEELSGYETLPIMRLRLGSIAEAPPEMDPEYISAVARVPMPGRICRERILGNITDQTGKPCRPALRGK